MWDVSASRATSARRCRCPREAPCARCPTPCRTGNACVPGRKCVCPRTQVSQDASERRHEQVRAHRLPGDRHAPLAEVDLQLPPRRCLEAHRRLRLRRQQPPVRRDRTLHGPQAGVDRQLALEILAHHLGVAAVPVEALLEPCLQTGELRGPPRTAVRHPARRRDVALHRVPAAAELRRDPLRPPPQLVEAEHGLHLVRPHHPSPPRSSRPRRIVALRHAFRLLPSLLEGGQLWCRQGVSFTCRLTPPVR